MFDPERLLGELLGGSLSGSLSGKKRKKHKSSLLGGLSTGSKAQLGVGLLGIAIAAYDHYKNQNRQAGATAGGTPPVPVGGPSPIAQIPPPPPGARLPTPAPAQVGTPPAAPVHDMQLLVQAMVAAAAADGHIDDAERTGILQRAADAGLDADNQAFLRAELAAPKSLAAIVAAARPEIAADVYAACCAAISLDSEAERVYLDTLAGRLGLAPEARTRIHQQLGLA